VKPLPDGWRQAHLGDLLDSLAGGVSLVGEDRERTEGEPGVLTLTAVSNGHFQPQYHKAVAVSERHRLGRSVSANTILISRSNTEELVGACALVERGYPDLHLPDLLWEMRSSRCELSWLYQYLVSPMGRIELSSRSVGTSGSMKKLSMQSLRSIPVPLPPPAEQREIASVLSAWDQGIRKTGSLIAAKRTFKQGLMQKLLSGNQRFGADDSNFQQVTVGEIVEKLASAVAVDAATHYREIGIRSHGKGIFHKEPVLGAVLGDKRVYKVEPECLTVNIVFAWEQAVAVTTTAETGLIASHRFPMFKPDKSRAEPKYLLHYFLSPKGSEALQLASPGGAGRNRTMSQSAFLKLKLPLPSIRFQQQFVSLVENLDSEIDLLSQQLSALKTQKKGLMRKLLTGEVRVKVPT
jgi:hypothetical protein